jgi:hypothetical protein
MIGFPASSTSNGRLSPLPKSPASRKTALEESVGIDLEAFSSNSPEGDRPRFCAVVWEGLRESGFAVAASKSVRASLSEPALAVSGSLTWCSSKSKPSFFSMSMPAFRSAKARLKISRFVSEPLPSFLELWNKLVSTLCEASFFRSSRFSSFLSFVSYSSHLLAVSSKDRC